MLNANNTLTEAVKEEDIVIICMLNLCLIHLKKIYLPKCIFNIHNIAKKRELIVKIQILEDLEEIEDKNADKKKAIKEKDQDQKTEKNKKREDILLQDHCLRIEEI